MKKGHQLAALKISRMIILGIRGSIESKNPPFGGFQKAPARFMLPYDDAAYPAVLYPRR